MYIYLNKKEIAALDYVTTQIGSYISEDEEETRKNNEVSDIMINLLYKIYKAQTKERTKNEN